MSQPSHPLLDSLRNDVEFYNDILLEVQQDVLKQRISKYPIFAFHKWEIAIGEPIIRREEVNSDWSVNATTLEEVVERGVIKPDRETAFKEAYKDPKDWLCIFLISEKGGNFIWIPFKHAKDQEEKRKGNGRKREE